jgi:FKBP-type peptidyl-prolyl cis-trans isomerase SlyD
MQIEKNTVATIDYTLTDPNGQVIDSSKGRQPLAYLHGASNIIPGLETALEGKDVGENINVTIPPEQGYGARDPNLVQPVPRSNFNGIAEINRACSFRHRPPRARGWSPSCRWTNRTSPSMRITRWPAWS